MTKCPLYYLSRNAETDLDDIWDYISDRNIDAADRLIDGFKSGFNLLAQQSLLGEIFDLERPFLRRFTRGNYVIYYQTSTDPITIVRVLHGARDAEGLV